MSAIVYSCLFFERGMVEAPAFMPVYPYGTVKA
jgi:queuine/archaeosine tRNA-ribosyltransferase